MLTKLRKKTLSSLSIFSLLLNLFQPFIITAPYFVPTQAHAQEEIVVVEESPDPIVVELTPVESPSPSTTPSPSPEPSPEPVVVEVELPAPAETQESILEEEPLPEPDLTPPQEETSAQVIPAITTDKLDYAPTGLAIITGSDLEPNTTYILRVSSQDPPATSSEAEVTTDDSGSLEYEYQLDGIYRPDYLVEVFDLGSALVATTTFTDTPVEKITICHATSAHNNPYIVNHPNKSGDVSGHDSHDGPIWFFGIEVEWGDIIPPFDYGDDGRSYPGKNWTTEGQVVWNNDCNFPGEPEPSSITIIKNEVPDLNTQFTFSVSGSENYSQIFSLYDNGSQDGTEQDTFSNLIAGDYIIDETNSAFPYTTSVSCSNDTSDTDHNITVSLGEGEDVACTFTNTLATSFLQGRKYQDNNQNGIMEQGEEFMDDWIVNLYDANWNPLGQRVTGHTGNAGQYRFPGLVPDTYHTCEVMQDGWFQTGPNLGDYAVNYDGDTPYGTAAVAVENLSSNSEEGGMCWQASTAGTDIGWLGFGNARTGSIRTEKITIPSDSDLEFEFIASYSDSPFYLMDGQYNESGSLIPGMYSLGEVTPDGWKLTDANCTDGEISFDPRGDEFELLAGQNLTCTFTNTELSSISGYKFEDQDGVLGGDTSTVPLWEIELWLEDNLEDTTITDSSGYYSFTNLLPGNYFLKEIMQAGWTNVLGTSTELNAPLLAGEVSQDNNFTNTQYGSIQGRKYNDVNGNGDFDRVEKDALGDPNRLDDWVITLYTSEWKYMDHMETGDDNTPAGNVGKGQYRFVNVYPSDYYVCETQQADWTQTEPSTGPTHFDSTRCHSITVNSSQAVTGIQFGNRQQGSLTIIKDVVPDDSSLWNFDLTGSHDYQASTVLGDNDSQQYTLLAGDYTITEESSDDYQTTITCTDDLVRRSIPTTSTNVNIQAGSDITCTFTNTRLSSIQGYKWHDRNANGVEESGDEKLPGWKIELFDADQSIVMPPIKTTFTSNHPETLGEYSFDNLLPGNYRVCEVLLSDWYNSTPICHTLSLPTNTPVITDDAAFVVDPLTYNFGNYQYGDLIVIKYSDYNGNGRQDEGEPLLSDWEMNLSQGETLGSELTDQDGEAIFSDLTPGNYYLSETFQDGWAQTNISCDLTPSLAVSHPHEFRTTEWVPSYPSNLRIDSGNTTTCYIGNQQNPALTISKSNDASGDKSPGDTVTFTLTVELTGSNLYGVQVVDLPATGFTYQLGSWTGTSTEPTYASPGTWILGDMVVGDIITLTYQAEIGSDVDPGNYRDLAYASGCKHEMEGFCEELVYATGIDSEYLEDHFVGTSVSIGGDSRETGSVDIEIEGEVLGATISLPATGTDSNWLYLALGLILSGLVMIFGGKHMRKLLLSLALIATFLSPTSALAADDPSLSIRIESPDSPTRVNNLDLAFTVLDLESRPVTATCYAKTPDSSSYIQFDTTKYLSAGGNHDSCSLDSSIMTTQGNYELYVAATAGSGVEESDHVTVTYDNEGPGQPTSFNKSRPWACRYTIQFHTASDNGLTEWVEIFGSTSTSFSTDNSTRVGSVGIGSDQDGEFHHDLTGDDCNLEWYYVIRAFDSAGNQSAHIGDELVTSTTIITETIEETNSLPAGLAAGSVLGEQEDSDEQGEILGDNSPDEPTEPEQVNITSWIQDNINEVQSSSNRFYILGGLIIFFGIIYVFIRRYRK